MKQMAKRMLAFLLAFGLVAMTGPVASLQVSAYAVPAQEIIYLSETEAPAEETPAEETPAEETPAEETPAEETPAEETPAEETPAEETPAEETPAEETPAEETPAEETPAEETPAEETPAEETPAPAVPEEQGTYAAGTMTTIYVDGAVEASGDGSTAEQAVKTLEEAYELMDLSADVTIVIAGAVTYNSGAAESTTKSPLPAHTGTVTITSKVSDSEDYTDTASLVLTAQMLMGGPTTLKDISLVDEVATSGAVIGGMGHKLVIDTGVKTTGSLVLAGQALGNANGVDWGGAAGETISDVTVKSGTWTTIYGISYRGESKGNAYLTITGGTITTRIVPLFRGNHTGNFYLTIDVEDKNNGPVVSEDAIGIFGCIGRNAAFTGSAYIDIKGNSVIDANVYASGKESSTYVMTQSGGTVNVSISENAKVKDVYAGGKLAKMSSGAAVITLSDNASVENIYAGGEEKATSKGDTTINLKGGTVNGKVVRTHATGDAIDGTVIVNVDLSGGDTLALSGAVTADTFVGGGSLVFSDEGALTVTDAAQDYTAATNASISGTPAAQAYIATPDAPETAFTWAAVEGGEIVYANGAWRYAPPSTSEDGKVYLDGIYGDDTNDGKLLHTAVKTLGRAYELLGDKGGKIVIIDTVTFTTDDGTFTAPSHTGRVTITAVDTDGTSYYETPNRTNKTGNILLAGNEMVFGGPTTIENVGLAITTGSSYLQANCHDLVIGEGVGCNYANTLALVGAVTAGNLTGDTSITVKSGVWTICGGTWDSGSSMTGDVTINIDGAQVQHLYGASANGTLNGNVTINATSGKLNRIITAGTLTGTVNGDIEMNIVAAEAGDITIPDSTTADRAIYASTYGGTVNGTSTLNIKGATVVGREVYGTSSGTPGKTYINIGENAVVNNLLYGGGRTGGTMSDVEITVSDNAIIGSELNADAAVSAGAVTKAVITLKGGLINGSVSADGCGSASVAVDLSKDGSLMLAGSTVVNTLTGGGELLLGSSGSLTVADSVTGKTTVSIAGLPQAKAYLTVPSATAADAFTWGNYAESWRSATEGSTTVWSIANAASVGEHKGITFTRDDFYQTIRPLPAVPRTFEAWIKVDKDASDGRLGVIASNYSDDDSVYPAVVFEIRTNGNPALRWVRTDGSASAYTFTNVDVRTGEWLHLAVTSTPASTACYVNGELKQILGASLPDYPQDQAVNIFIGNDMTEYYNKYALIDTEVSSLAMFSDVRTASELLADMTAVDASDSALIGSYNLGAEGVERLRDASAQQNHLFYSNTIDDKKNESYVQLTTASEGISITKSDEYTVSKAYNEVPMTYEASIYFPTHTPLSEYGGYIVGGVTAKNLSRDRMGISVDGTPFISLSTDSGTLTTYRFTDVMVYTGKWVHLAIVRDDANQKVHCYIDGELKQTLDMTAVPFVKPNIDAYKIGLPWETYNRTQPRFKGNIRSLAFYNDVRTADEVKADSLAAASSPDKDGLIAAYDLSQAELPSYEDLSGNGYTVNYQYNKFWLEPEEKRPLEDYAYSMAVIPDTQYLVRDRLDLTENLYAWLVDNAEEKKIKLVMGLGDITDDDTDTEWAGAVKAISQMDGKIPYSIVRGNHDTEAQFNKYIGASNYVNEPEGRYNGTSVLNTWHELVVGGRKYLILCLDYGPSDAVLEWASGVVEAHPEHNVIVTTHAYLADDGTTQTAGVDLVTPSRSGQNCGDMMWDKFVSKHENIVLVLCGHIASDKIVVTQRKGDNGNTVTEMLIDTQQDDLSTGLSGFVSMFYFSEDGKTVQVELYSTVKDLYFQEANQFTMQIDVVGEDTPADPEIDVTVTNNTKAAATVTEPADGWKEGTNTFTVKSDAACYVAVSCDNGATYTRIPAVASGESYSFTVDNVTESTKIVVGLVGDVNGDGEVSNSDATKLAAIYAGKSTAADALMSMLCDVNADGEVSNSDVTKIRAAYAGKSSFGW